MLNALMIAGEVDMLAEVTERTLIYSPGAINAINTYYGHGAIPIGANKGDSFLPDDGYAQHLDENFPNNVSYASAPEAIALLRQTLAAQVGPVPILCTGPLRLLSQLLQSSADGYSALAGNALVAAKVSFVVAVAGRWNTTEPEYNFYKDPVAGNYVFANCPVPIVIVPIEMGDTITTGAGLTANTPIGNPVRKAYEIHKGEATGQKAWAQLGALYLARGLADGETTYFTAQEGFGTVDSATGAVLWTGWPGRGRHWKLSKVMSDPDFVTLIDGWLEVVPA